MSTALLLLLLSGVGGGPEWQPRLDATIEGIVREGGVPGLAVGVVEHGKLVYARAWGVMSLATRKPVTERSLFHLASVTKLFVATSIMQLVEQGEIELDQPVVKYLPYFRLADEASLAITIRQLLSHSGGMPDVQDYEWDKPQYDDEALERWVRSLATFKLIGRPGERFAYSNIGFEVLADVIAKVSGVPFEDYVHEHILEPLGMASSTLLKKEADPDLLTSPHVPAIAGGFEVSQVFPYNRCHAGSSTLYSSIADLSRFAIATLRRGGLEDHRILNGSTYDLMWTPSRVAGSPVGLGWFLGSLHGHRTVSHSGGDTGFRSNLVLVPDRDLGVIVLQNSTSDAVKKVSDALLEAALR